MQYPLYGSTLFPVAYRGYWEHGTQLVLGVNAGGVLLLKPCTSATINSMVLFQFPYQDIESLIIDPHENCVTLSMRKPPPSPQQPQQQQQRVFVLETASKAEIGSLVASYYPNLANSSAGANAAGNAGGNNAGVRKLKQTITNEDRLRLNSQLVNCRRALIESNLLKKPLDDGGKGFIKNTLRKLSTRKLEKLRAEALTNEQGEVYKGFPHTYWAFSKSVMTQTLSNMAADVDETAATQIFSLILQYAGLITVNNKENQPQNQQQQQNPQEVNLAVNNSSTANGVQTAPRSNNNKDEDDSHVVLIQTVLDRAMRKDCLVNEVFMQLIKQTTDHPEPNRNPYQITNIN